MEDETLLATMLFDFFGDLLTEKQRDYFDLYHNEDLSLSEIAARDGISRQGVHDVLARAENSLREMERKTGVVRRWLDMRSDLEAAGTSARRLLELSAGGGEAEILAQALVSALEAIRNS